jgi:hypothetical protein
MICLKRFIVIGILLLCFVLITSAQEQRPQEPPLPHKVEQFKKMRLIEELHLDEETSIRFFARYNKQMDAIREIEWQRNTIIKQLKELIHSNAIAN